LFADSGLSAETIESSGRAVVKADFLAVYSNMTKESAVVKFLKKGEVVTIELGRPLPRVMCSADI
jgi:uncharacterized protein YgiM (DUF1202 family)